MSPKMPASMPARVQSVYAAYPAKVRARLLQLRRLLLRTAARLDGVGPLEECLRWGQPTYLTTASRSGSMLRLDQHDDDGATVGLYVHCQTRLVSEYRARYPELRFDGRRAVLLPVAGRLPQRAVADCMALALTYRLRSGASRPRLASTKA